MNTLLKFINSKRVSESKWRDFSFFFHFHRMKNRYSSDDLNLKKSQKSTDRSWLKLFGSHINFEISLPIFSKFRRNVNEKIFEKNFCMRIAVVDASMNLCTVSVVEEYITVHAFNFCSFSIQNDLWMPFWRIKFRMHQHDLNLKPKTTNNNRW